MNPKKLLSKMAKSVSIEVTTCCPLNCVYCERKIKNQTMSYEKFLQIKEMIEQDEKIERITFCGIGESFLHADIYKMIDDLKNYKITIITSGTVLIDFEQLCKNDNVDVIIFSIDSPSKEEILDICGENYNYNILVENIDRLSKCVKVAAKKHKLITTVINCTINEKNLNRLVAMIDFAFLHKFSSIHFSLPWGKYELVEKNFELLKKEFEQARLKAVKHNIYMENPMGSFCCISHDHIMPYIDVNGYYYSCASALYIKEASGNICEESIQNIQCSNNAQKLYDGQLCNDCTLYQFNRLEVEKSGK